MQLVTYSLEAGPRLGAVRDDTIVDLCAAAPNLPTTLLGLLEAGDDAMHAAHEVLDWADPIAARDRVRLHAPLPRPPRVLAVAQNYADHIAEIAGKARVQPDPNAPEAVPVIFNKQITAVTGPHDPILVPPESHQIDYEAELAVVIGKTCRRVAEADAFDVIAGYTILNDVSVRDWQRASKTMTLGKSWDSHCPMGPALVTADAVPEPGNLGVTCHVDGELRQGFNTSGMVFGIRRLIAHLSTAMTLLPGDVIATGTGSGVAAWREDTPWLKPGQSVRIAIDGLGEIDNPVAEDPGDSFIK